MPDFEPILLAQVGKPESHTRRVYEQSGGYATLRKVLKGIAPKDVIETVKTSGLRGRGGAGFPTGLKWTFLPPNHPGPIYFCLNADESEPGTFNNRILMELDPKETLLAAQPISQKGLNVMGTWAGSKERIVELFASGLEPHFGKRARKGKPLSARLKALDLGMRETEASKAAA